MAQEPDAMLAEASTAATRSFPATLPEIAAVDRWIEDLGAKWQVPEAVVFRARVCLAELATNVWEHGHGRPGGDEITIALSWRPPAIEVEMSDTGRGFDPTHPPAHPATEEIGGGRGLRLVRNYATAMTYRRDSGRNHLSLR